MLGRHLEEQEAGGGGRAGGRLSTGSSHASPARGQGEGQLGVSIRGGEGQGEGRVGAQVFRILQLLQRIPALSRGRGAGMEGALLFLRGFCPQGLGVLRPGSFHRGSVSGASPHLMALPGHLLLAHKHRRCYALA